MVEKSLILIKPDAMERGLWGKTTHRGRRLAPSAKMLHMDMALAEKHYAPHKDKPFFKSLTGYISSAPIVAAVFEGEGAVDLIRKIMGTTDPAKAAEGTIRGDLGIDIEHNSIPVPIRRNSKEVELFFQKDELFSF